MTYTQTTHFLSMTFAKNSTQKKNLIILYLHNIKEELINDIDMRIRIKCHTSKLESQKESKISNFQSSGAAEGT